MTRNISTEDENVDSQKHPCRRREGGDDSLIKVGTDVRARALGFQGSIFARALDFGR